MRNNTEEVKKNFLKKIKMILSIIMLSLIVVPCITSCIHGNNPNKPADKVEEKKPENNSTSPPIVTPETDEQKIARILKNAKVINAKLPLFDQSTEEEAFEKSLLSLCRKKDNQNRLYLFTDDLRDKSGQGYKRGIIEDVEDIQREMKHLVDEMVGVTYVRYEIPSPHSDGFYFNSIEESLDYRWGRLLADPAIPESFYPVAFENTTMPFFYTVGANKCYRLLQPFNVVFAVKSEVGKDPEVYFSRTSGMEVRLDWVITLANDNEIYTFKVGPYLLANVSKAFLSPPVDDAEYVGKTEDMIKNYKKDVFHMLRLSTLIRISLYQNMMGGDTSKIIPANIRQAVDNYLSSDKNPFGLDFVSLNNWNAYLTFVSYSSTSTARFTNTTKVWRDTFKLNNLDAKGQQFWNRCWN